MANKTPLTEWLYENSAQLSAQFKEFSWPQKYEVGLFDFATTISYQGVSVNGRGVDESREIAIEKSVAEAIERLIAKLLGFESHAVEGFAVGGKFDPRAHARFEAFERYYLNNHIEQKISFRKVSHNRIKIANMVNNTSFYQMLTPKDLYGIVCVIRSKNNESALGFALSKSIDLSIKKSWLEAMPNFAWLDSGFVVVQKKPWHISDEFLNRIVPLFLSDFEFNERHPNAEPELVEIEVPFSQIAVLKSAPLSAARYLILKG